MCVFLKLSGSLITNKETVETPQINTIRHLAHEIADALAERPDLRLLVGHGNGSFGHIAAQQYGTRDGVRTDDDWLGFAHISVLAARLNQLVLDALHDAGVPVFRVQPSASARCVDGQLIDMFLEPINQALKHGLVPLVHGDVAIDEKRGGTLVNIDSILAHLARQIKPRQIILAGEQDGILDSNRNLIPHISPESLDNLWSSPVGVDSVDERTASKVVQMLALCEALPGFTVRFISGLNPGLVKRCLVDEMAPFGTLLAATQG